MVNITKAIAEAGASIRILDMNIDTTTPAGALMLNIFSSVAQFERDIMLERQRIGIEGKKRLDKNLPLDQRTYKGRAPTAMKKAECVRALLALGTKSKQQVAAELGRSGEYLPDIKKGRQENERASQRWLIFNSPDYVWR